MTSVKPDGAMPDPARLSGLKMEISGLEGSELSEEVLNGGRQRYKGGILEVLREKIPTQAGYLLPYPDEAGRMRPFLAPEMNIQSDDEEVRKKVREICGNDREPAAVARKLLDWVFRNVEKRPVLSVPSALEVLRTKVGDCNEHATLLAAFLRAAGIPARLCIGLAYSRDRFYYHAWTEAYLGEWITLDATLNQMPVDPGHVKLVEGNLEKQVVIAGLVGEIRVKVLDFQYD
jgi:transglutaminase-like putative cysteine protease